jgi:sulfate transport system permease protein
MVRQRRSVIPGFGLTLGTTLLCLSLVVLIPLAALFLKSAELSADRFISILTSGRAPHGRSRSSSSAARIS